MISSRKATLLVAILCCSVFLVSCGDYYRSTVTPIPKPGGDPQASDVAMVLTASPSNGRGGTMSLDLTGDTNMGNHFTGRGVIRAALAAGTATSLYTLNSADNTVSVVGYAAASTVSTVTLLEGSSITSLGSTRSGTMYVTMTGDNSFAAENCPGSGLLGVIRGTSLETHVCVGANPVWVTGSPDQSRAYVLNNGSDSVSVVDTTSRTVVTTIALPGGSAPVKALAHPGRAMLYVLNGNGTVSAIDTTNLTVASTFSTGGSNPVDIVYDPHFSRLVVLNAGNSLLRVFDLPVDLPTANHDVTVGASPSSVVVLPDGSRAYVANSGDDTISVINLTTYAEKTRIALTDTPASPGPHTPVSVSASRSSARVVVANSGSQDVSIIHTDTDAEVTDGQGAPARLPAPYQDPACVPTTSTPCARQSPIQVLTLVKQ